MMIPHNNLNSLTVETNFNASLKKLLLIHLEMKLLRSYSFINNECIKCVLMGTSDSKILLFHIHTRKQLGTKKWLIVLD